MPKIDKTRIVLIIAACVLATSGSLLSSGFLAPRESVYNSSAVNVIVPNEDGKNSREPGDKKIESVIKIDLFCDSNCSDQLVELCWGELEPGISVSKTMYIMNRGNTPVILKCLIENWRPVESIKYISIIWDKEEAVLAVGEFMCSKFTLSVDPNIPDISDYSFDISIEAIAV